MLRGAMTKKDTAGFFLRPPRQLVNRLTELSAEFNKGSANQVAVEVLNDYLEFWVDVQRAKQEVLAMQQEKFSKMKSEMLRQPLFKAEAESGKKPEAQGRKRK